MSTPVSRQQAAEINNHRLDGSEVLLIQRGIGTDPTTISSMRESVHAEAPSFLCGCFTSFVNWIKEIFLSCFDARASHTEEPSETRTSELEARQRMLEKADEFINRQFNQTELDFPLKTIVTIRFNGRIIGMPHGNIIGLEQFEAFKEQVKRSSLVLIQAQSLQADARLEIESYFLNNTSNDPNLFVYEMRCVSDGISYSIGDGGTASGRSSGGTRFGLMNTQAVQQHFNRCLNQNEQLIRDVNVFLVA